MTNIYVVFSAFWYPACAESRLVVEAGTVPFGMWSVVNLLFGWDEALKRRDQRGNIVLDCFPSSREIDTEVFMD